jgi:hypothetical protein
LLYNMERYVLYTFVISKLREVGRAVGSMFCIGEPRPTASSKLSCVHAIDIQDVTIGPSELELVMGPAVIARILIIEPSVQYVLH